MRWLAAFLGLICTASVLLARDIVTLSGHVYKNATVTSVLGNGIRVSHNDGVAFIDFKDLPAELKKEFGYSPEAYAGASAAYQQQGVAIQQTQDRERYLADQLIRAQARADAAEQTAAAALARAADARYAGVEPNSSSIASRDYGTPRYTGSSYSTRDYTTPRYTGGSVSVRGYFRKDGTYVRPHTRKR